MHRHLAEEKISRLVIYMSFIVYGTAYIGRVDYTTALANMIKDGGLSKSQVGLVGTIFFICYGVGQLINGMIGDRVSPFKMISIGLLVSAATNFMMSGCRNYLFMSLIWGVNGFAQSMLWAPILYLFTNVIPSELKHMACLYISISYPAGTIFTYLMSIVVLKYAGWNCIFFASSVILLVVAVLWISVWAYSSKYLLSDAIPESRAGNTLSDSPSGNFPSLFLLCGGIFLLVVTMIHGMLKEGISVWVPTLICETYGVSSTFSLFLSMFLPAAGLAGPYLIAYFYHKMQKKDEMTLAAFCFLIAIPMLIILLFIGKLPILISVAMLSMVTVAMSALNYTLITLVPLHFSSYNRASTATGLFNSITYLGCAVSTFGFGWLSDGFGWGKTIFSWVGIAVAGIFFCVLTFKRWRQFVDKNDKE